MGKRDKNLWQLNQGILRGWNEGAKEHDNKYRWRKEEDTVDAV